MSRLKADLLLVIVTIIWGSAFIAQKIGMDIIGPYLFVGVRMGITAFVLIPLLIWERNRKGKIPPSDDDHKEPFKLLLLGLCFAFTGGVIAQQAGIVHTTVTNSGFLTALYVLFTPLIAWSIFKMRPNKIVLFAGPLSLIGVFLLGDASFTKLSIGDWYIVLSALFFGFHIVLISVVVKRSKSPYLISFTQCLICACIGLVLALQFEVIELEAIYKALPALLYAGLLSGGIAYTLQIIAQQYTPASDAAVIMSAESLVAAMAGAILLGDRLSLVAWGGCACILGAVLLVELWPVISKKISGSKTSVQTG